MMPSVFKNKPRVAELVLERAPVDVFGRLYGSEQYGFLYESLESKKLRGRYSFAGGRPGIVFTARRKNSQVLTKRGKVRGRGDPFYTLEKMISFGKRQTFKKIFSGGAVGYIAYDAVRNIEKIPDENREYPILPEFYFIFPTEIIIFDHYKKKIQVIVYGSKKRLRFLVEVLREPRSLIKRPAQDNGKSGMMSNMKPVEFRSIVRKAKKYIREGDIFQVVLSQRFVTPVRTSPFDIYQRLRQTNPSPYMYYLKLADLDVLGSSPETLIKLQDRQIISRPIAGTRPRGRNQQEDNKLADELLNDEKERAEHVMLVDLARNDVGRVAVSGSVRVPGLMRIEKYSKVMHITSKVTGELEPGLNAFDVFKAAFPAGTVSGAPKVRAMEIIDELETLRRGIYAGAIGYFGFDGNMDFCIAIRTMIIYQRKAYIQSGAGIVADSVPAKEYQETIDKMSALKSAMAAN